MAMYRYPENRGLGDLGDRLAIVVDCQFHGRSYMAVLFPIPEISADSHYIPAHFLSTSCELIEEWLVSRIKEEVVLICFSLARQLLE